MAFKWCLIPQSDIIKKNTEKIQKTLRKRYQNLSEEEINRKREYMCKQYKILHKMKQKSGWVKNEILQNEKLIILISGLHFNKKSKT